MNTMTNDTATTTTTTTEAEALYVPPFSVSGGLETAIDELNELRAALDTLADLGAAAAEVVADGSLLDADARSRAGAAHGRIANTYGDAVLTLRRVRARLLVAYEATVGEAAE